jgi:hypothetical protein
MAEGVVGHEKNPCAVVVARVSAGVKLPATQHAGDVRRDASSAEHRVISLNKRSVTLNVHSSG